MASIKDLKKRLCRLKIEATDKEDIRLIKNEIRKLRVDLNEIFQAGREGMKPKERALKAYSRYKLARTVLSNNLDERMFGDALDGFEQVVKKVGQWLPGFVNKHGIPVETLREEELTYED